MKMIEFPDMRLNVLDNVILLSDLSYQERVWVRHEKVNGVQYDAFSEVIHCLYDDSSFERDPRRTIGTLLFDENEAGLIKNTMDLIDELFDKYGRGLSDDEYIHKPEWPSIMASAENAYKAMMANDLRFMEPAQRAELYKKYRIEA
jgi:hypothetical protein